ncbi:MAG: hypothetical protein ABI847_01420 [Anaerolineales bacterium]
MPPLDFQGGQRRALDGLFDLPEIVQVQTVLAQGFAYRRLGRRSGQVEF